MKYDNLNSTGDQLSAAIWEAAWWSVNRSKCNKDEFVAMVTRAANEAFDSQVHNKKNAVLFVTNHDPPKVEQRASIAAAIKVMPR
jgi:hypothetical protein